MISSLRQIFARNRWSAIAGLAAGCAVACGWAAWFHNFAPYADERTSAWKASGTEAPDQRHAATFFQPRIDELLRRVRVDGRSGGSAWRSLRAAANAWLLSDPIGCLNHLSEIGAIPLIDGPLLDEALRRETGGNFSTALRRADELSDPRVYRLWLSHAFGLEASIRPARALQALASLPIQFRAEFHRMLLQTWVKRDGPGAFEASLKSDIGTVASGTAVARAVSAGYAWAGDDPEAAYAYFSRLPEDIPVDGGRSIPRSRMLSAAIFSMAKSDPAKALILLNELPESGMKLNSRRRVLVDLAGRDTSAALAAADAIPGDIERIKTLAALADAVAKSDPVAAARIREDLPGERTRIGNQPLEIWNAHSDRPVEAVQAAAAVTDPVARGEAMRTATEFWFQQKPDDAIAFAVSQARNGAPESFRILTDSLIDRADADTSANGSWAGPMQNLGTDTRALLVRELQAQPPGPGRDRILAILQ